MERTLVEIAGKQGQEGSYPSHLLPFQLSGTLLFAMFDELWIMLDLSFDLLLQATDLFASGLCGRIVGQLRFIER